MVNFKFIATLFSGMAAVIFWLLFTNKKQEVERLEKENAEKDLINQNILENAKIKRDVESSDFSELSSGLRNKRKNKARK